MFKKIRNWFKNAFRSDMKFEVTRVEIYKCKRNEDGSVTEKKIYDTDEEVE